jgi:hypothetical protein
MIPKKVQKGQPITADMINGIIDSIRETQIQTGVGYSFSRNAGGTTLSIKSTPKTASQAVSEICPFDVAGTVSGTDLVLTLSVGMVNGVVPSNILTSITSTTSGVKYAVVNCESDGKNVVSASWAVVSSLPVPPTATINVAPPTFGVMVAAISGSTIYKSIPCGNVVARVSPSIQVDSVTYSAGLRNYSQYFVWVY